MSNPELEPTPRLELQVLERLGLAHLAGTETKFHGVLVENFLDAYPNDSPRRAETTEELEHFMGMSEEDEGFALFHRVLQERIRDSLKM